ncbi:hypothetical protein Egran_00421 [Elaphomyces granulatus]|uniref:Peptidase M28 domain-containing protein n=1 Tax=Elaphomyces granulatus TaxID=519963 RepID=A0A232M654_9EURO|nr:hypothetical protein Egran_00421 [Elaphomyces granulatus]
MLEGKDPEMKTRSVMKSLLPNNAGATRKRPQKQWTAAILLIGALLLFGYTTLPDAALTSSLRNHFGHWQKTLGFSEPQQHFTSKDLQQIILTVPDSKKAREWNLYYTSEPHYLGQGEQQAVWTQQKWREFGVKNISIEYFPVPIPVPTPIYQRIALLRRDTDNKKDTSDTELYVALLRENSQYVNPVSSKIISTPQYAAYAPSGNVTAQYMYVNFGRDCDYDDLQRASIGVEGKIAIRKQGVISGSTALMVAQKRGVVGVIWYPDPQFDGEVTESHGYVPYPEGPARAPDSVLRRAGVKLDSLYQITLPVIPISFSEAVPLLQALNDYGPKPSDLGEGWGGGQLEYRGVQYNTGPSPDGVVINLVNHMESKNVSAIDVIGTIKGTIENEVVILGNHRDAWVVGAGDPNSGSAVLNEVIRSLGVVVKRGWKPRRTLMFASWDGHESRVWGSQLWLHANLPLHLNTTVAYLEVITAATGSEFYTKASPLLQDVIRDTTAQVLSPNRTQPGQSVRHNNWDGHLESEGGGDCIYFVMDGITSMNAGFRPGPTDPVFHWHSDFDTVEWMDKFGDPTWGYHVASAQIWALTAARLADQPILPFNVSAFADALGHYLRVLKDKLNELPAELSSPLCSFDLEPLGYAITQLQPVAWRFDAHAAALTELLESDNTAYQKHSHIIQEINFKYRTFDQNFVHLNGEPGGGLKNVVFGRSTYRLNMPAFPDLTYAIEKKDWCEAEVSTRRICTS